MLRLGNESEPWLIVASQATDLDRELLPLWFSLPLSQAHDNQNAEVGETQRTVPQGASIQVLFIFDFVFCLQRSWEN